MSGEFRSGENRSRVVLIVLGMHRSGTSVLARLLSFAGAVLPCSVIPPGQDNPKGFWESPIIIAFNDKLLSAVGCDWYEIGGVDVSPLVNDEALLCEAEVVIAQEFANTPLFVLKDPRICRLLPFWSEVFKRLKIECKVLIPFRSPFEVAESLRRRDGFPLKMGVWLWLRHFLDAERNSRSFPRVFLDFDVLLDDWRIALQTLSIKLDIDLLSPAHSNTLEIDKFIEPDLATSGRAVVGILLDSEIDAVYCWAMGAAKGVEGDSECLSIINSFVERLDALMLNDLSKVFYLKKRQCVALSEEIQLSKKSFEKVEHQIDAARHFNGALSNQLDVARQNIENLVAELDAARQNIENLVAELDAAKVAHLVRDETENDLHAKIDRLDRECAIHNGSFLKRFANLFKLRRD